MIKRTDKSISKPDNIFNLKDRKRKSSFLNKKTKELKEVFSQIDNKQIKPSDNPIEEDKNHAVNLIQEYFNKKYFKIRIEISNILEELYERNFLRSKINSLFLLSQILYEQYLKKENLFVNNKEFTLDKEKGKIFLIEENKIVFEMFFDDFGIRLISEYCDDIIYQVYLRKKSYFKKLLNLEENIIDKFIKIDDKNKMEEVFCFDRENFIEKYIKLMNNKKLKVSFEKNQFKTNQNSKNNVFISEYVTFENDNKINELKYLYGIPTEYKEFNPITLKIDKWFLLQGIKSKVYKYTLFNSLNGQMILCKNFE